MSAATLRARLPIPGFVRTGVRAMRSRDERDDLRAELRRRWGTEPPLPCERPQNVLVICYGNICRSPFAGLDLALRNPGLVVRTAGLEAGEPRKAESGALRVAAELGFDLESHRSHRMTGDDADWADLVVAMQGRHRETIRGRWPETVGKVRLLGDYLARGPHLIEDPWGCEDDVFRDVFRRIRLGNDRLTELLSGRGER